MASGESSFTVLTSLQIGDFFYSNGRLLAIDDDNDTATNGATDKTSSELKIQTLYIFIFEVTNTLNLK